MTVSSARRVPRSRCRRVGASTVWVLAGLLLVVGPSAGGPWTAAAQATSYETVGISSSRLSRVTEALEAYVEAGDLPGAVILVARDGRVVLHEAVGRRDLDRGIPQQPDDLFRIASQTKPS